MATSSSSASHTYENIHLSLSASLSNDNCQPTCTTSSTNRKQQQHRHWPALIDQSQMISFIRRPSSASSCCVDPVSLTDHPHASSSSDIVNTTMRVSSSSDNNEDSIATRYDCWPRYRLWLFYRSKRNKYLRMNVDNNIGSDDDTKRMWYSTPDHHHNAIIADAPKLGLVSISITCWESVWIARMCTWPRRFDHLASMYIYIYIL